ncbi:9546_t:CDS:2, partial [Entrophospora sp. SA101]
MLLLHYFEQNVKDLQAKHRSLWRAYGEEAQRYNVDKECRLWRETLDEASFIDTTCRPMVNQFDVEEIQVAADVIHLNVLVRTWEEFSFRLCGNTFVAEFITAYELSSTFILALRNIVIVSKSLLVRTLEQ